MEKPVTNEAARVVIGLIALSVLVTGEARPVQAQVGHKRSTSADVVKAGFVAGVPDASGKQTMNVLLYIAKGWHIYANPVGQEDLEAGRTVITATCNGKPQPVKVKYPPGIVNEDKILKVTYRTYEGTVTIPVAVQRAMGDTGPLGVSVRVRACNDNQCLAPATIKLTVP